MKPDWKDAPEWARWLAQDKDGLWWFYSLKPEQSIVRWRSHSRCERAQTTESPEWAETLERRP